MLERIGSLLLVPGATVRPPEPGRQLPYPVERARKIVLAVQSENPPARLAAWVSVDTPNVAAIRCYPMKPDMRIATPLKILATGLFFVAVPLFLIAFNVRWVVNFPPLYAYGFDRYDIPDYTGIERGELLSAGRQIRDYFNNDADLLEINVVVRGIRVSNLYNEREVLHMHDVKGLVKGVYRSRRSARCTCCCSSREDSRSGVAPSCQRWAAFYAGAAVSPWAWFCWSDLDRWSDSTGYSSHST